MRCVQSFTGTPPAKGRKGRLRPVQLIQSLNQVRQTFFLNAFEPIFPNSPTCWLNVDFKTKQKTADFLTVSVNVRAFQRWAHGTAPFGHILHLFSKNRGIWTIRWLKTCQNFKHLLFDEQMSVFVEMILKNVLDDQKSTHDLTKFYRASAQAQGVRKVIILKAPQQKSVDVRSWCWMSPVTTK